MKKFITYALVGLGGYFIGFYEYKYKFNKVLLESFIEKALKEQKQKESE